MKEMEIFDQQKFQKLCSELETRLKNMGERRAMNWVKKHKEKWTRKTVAKCLK